MTKHSRKKIQIDMVAFRRDVESGTSVLLLAEKYGIAKSTVWRLKAEISGKLARKERAPEDAEVEAPEAYDITLNVATDRLDDLLSQASDEELRQAVLSFDPHEKANLLATVLQGRLTQVSEPPMTNQGEVNAQA